MDILAAIPVKPFGVAKARLGPAVPPTSRARLGRAIAARTANAAQEAGAQTVIVTGDPGVARWAGRLGFGVLDEGRPGLDAAAAMGVSAARSTGAAWAIVHADLPLVEPADLAAAFDAVQPGTAVLAPSLDGGTNLVAGDIDEFEFSYGSASFHRHLRSAMRFDSEVIVRVGTALDLDTTADLQRALHHDRGRWLEGYLS